MEFEMAEISTLSDSVRDAVSRYSDSNNPSAYLALNEGNSYLEVPGVPGVAVYRPTGKYLVQFGGPFAPPEARPALLSALVNLAAEQGRRIVAVQLQRPDTPAYLAAGFTVHQMGCSYAANLDTFTLRGTRFMQLRNKISRAMRTGLTISEVPLEQWADAMGELDAAWLTTKGPDAQPLEFLVGQYGGRYQSLRR